MDYFYTSSPNTKLDHKRESELTPVTDVTRAGKLQKRYGEKTYTVTLFTLRMSPIERLWTSISLIFVAPLSLLFPGLRDKVSEYCQGVWFIHSITQIVPKLDGSPAAISAARVGPVATAGLPATTASTTVLPAQGLPASSHPVAPKAATTAAASGGGSGRAVSYEMSAPPKELEIADEVLAGRCSILDRSVQRSLAKQLPSLPSTKTMAVINTIKEQIIAATSELTSLMAIRDENDFVQKAPRMKELFTGLFDCLYAQPDFYSGKDEGVVNACYLAAPYAGCFRVEFPFADAAIESVVGDDYLNFAFNQFVPIVRQLCELGLEHRLLVDCEYPLHLLERRYANTSGRNGSPLATDTDDNIAILFRNYLQMASPYLAGRLNAFHTVGATLSLESLLYESLLSKCGALTDGISRAILGYAKEVHEAVQILQRTGSEMIRIEDWPSSVRPSIRALFDLTDTTNLVGLPGLQEIAHGPDWQLIRVPQETNFPLKAIHPLSQSDCPTDLCAVLGPSAELVQLRILAETGAIGYALLHPLISGTFGKKSVAEVRGFLDNLEALKGATSIEDFCERLLSNSGPLVPDVGREQIAEIRSSFLGAQKAKDFLIKALSGETPLEKLLTNRRFIYHLYRYLWFLDKVEQLPDLNHLEEPAQLSKFQAFIRSNPLNRKKTGKMDADKYLLQPLTRVGNREIVRIQALDYVRGLMDPSRIVIYQEQPIGLAIPLMAVAIARA